MSKVSLVGAGPGDVSLLSLRALEEIKKADVIVYDKLIPDSLLNEAKLNARLIYAGKEASKHYLKQEEINKLLIKLAKEYELVVRLKGGDPYVFGRGGEEAQALQDAGIEYELISGISSPIAAPASLGIPLSHRDYASSFHIITGQERKNGEPKLDYDLLAKLDGTYVFMMSLNNIKTIVDKLLLFGKDANTPLSIISRGTYIDKQRYDFSLGNLAKILEKDEKAFISSIKRPALMVLGEVASLNLRYNRQVSQKKTLLVIGTRQFCKKISAEAKNRDVNIIKLSLIETIIEEEKSFSSYIRNIGQYSYIVFTSPNGVDCFFEYIKAKKIDIRSLAHLKFAVIGSGTKESLANRGIVADFMPSKFSGAYLATELVSRLKSSDKLVLFRAKESNNDIVDILKENNISYDDVALYKTIIDYRRRDELNKLIRDFDYICISSGTAARALSILLEDRKKLKDKIISIGPSTSAICKKYNLDVYKTAKEYSAKGILDVIENL